MQGASSCPRAGVIGVGPLLKTAQLGDPERELHGGRGGHIQRIRMRGLKHAARKGCTRCRIAQWYVRECGKRTPDKVRSYGKSPSSGCW